MTHLVKLLLYVACITDSRMPAENLAVVVPPKPRLLLQNFSRMIALITEREFHKAEE